MSFLSLIMSLLFPRVCQIPHPSLAQLCGPEKVQNRALTLEGSLPGRVIALSLASEAVPSRQEVKALASTLYILL